MSHTDPIADLITRIRNALMVQKKTTSAPLSAIKLEIVKLFKQEGYISDFKVDNSPFPPVIEIELKYGMDKKSVIEGLRRVSKPGRRVYVGAKEIPQVLGGLGVALLSTPQGVITGQECKKRHIGGELLLHIW